MKTLLSTCIALGLFATLAGCADGTEVPPLPQVQEPDVNTPNPNLPTGCAVGSIGCACSSGGGCGLTADGDQLRCTAGVCLLPSCPPGDFGCECLAGDRCNEGDCEAGYCRNRNCAAGSLNCDCLFGGCDVGLFCQAGAVCVDQTGFEGGECFANGTCAVGNRCDLDVDRCIFCDRGTQGCACTDLGSCNQGLTCSAGNCVAGIDLPPTNPRCYTPCRGDLTEGGTERACSADHLMDGCIGDASCVDGSCLLPGQLKPTCNSDVECPFYQACLQGECFSNCETSADCPTGLGCHQRVCRAPCLLTTGTSACPNGETCDSSDGETGFCVAIRPPAAEPTPLPQGESFRLRSSDALRLTNLRPAAALEIVTTGTASQTVQVQKLSHRLRFADGSVETIESPVDAAGNALPCSGASVSCPLWWIHLGEAGGEAAPRENLDVFLPGGCGDACPTVVVGNADGSPGVSYEGRLLVTGPGGTQEVTVRYVQSVEGRWQGTVHYFTNFGDEGLQEWIDSTSKADVSNVRNALIQRWGAFRRGNLEGVEELDAVLAATRTGSWEQPRVQELCDAVTGGSETAVCYPYSNPEGVRRYVQNTTLDPVPSATTELPLAFNLKNSGDDGTILTGRIDSNHALQYPNNPAISIAFQRAPSLPGACDPRIESDCVVFLKTLEADVVVGGRYISETQGCAPGYSAFTVPWLLPDFTEKTHFSEGVLSRTECRDANLPFADPDLSELNVEQAGANPTPDGKPRQRKLELLDGALINQTTLFFLFRETFPSFLPAGEPVSAYGFVSMKRSAAELDDDEYVGLAAPEPVGSPPEFGARCRETINSPAELASLLLDGTAAQPDAVVLPAMTDGLAAQRVHYLCAGQFDTGGSFEEATDDPFGGGVPPLGSGYIRDSDDVLYILTPTECLPGEDVTFFYTDNTLGALEVTRDACNETRTCQSRLNAWITAGRVIDTDPIWNCKDPTRALCDDDLADRRVGKNFFMRGASAPLGETVPSLSVGINDAFRYKTRFVSGLDDNLGVGFTPLICTPGSDEYPYCYDPIEIERMRDRHDCLVDIYSNRRAELPPAVQVRVDAAMRQAFSEGAATQGFERLYAELVVMLGDEELTGAFASRFDLAGVDTENFEGSEFETDGINLSSVAGAEMAKLYRAVQYYSLAIDRFYAFGPHFARALSSGDTSSPTNLISPQTVTLYLPRVVRASAQRAFAWSEIAKRYRDFNRPDLAQKVLARAYAQTYLESVLIARMMIDINERSQSNFRDQIAFELLQVQRTFRVALLDMREVFEEVSRGTTFFGFPREYVPFPAIDSSSLGANGFDLLIQSARTKMLTAKEREQIAFDSLISSRLDVAQFQSELVRVRNSFEDQLETICGTFVGDDGARYPAIRKYADKGELALITGDPCGTFASGTLYEQMLQVDAATAALDGVMTRYRNARADIRDEQRRVTQQCEIVGANAEYEYQVGAEIRDLEESLRITQLGIGTAVKALGIASEGVQSYANCITAVDPLSKGICAGLATIGVGFGVVSAGLEFGLELNASNVQTDIQNKRLDSAKWITSRQCDAASVDAARTMAQMVRGLDEITLEALRAEIALQIEMAQVARTQNEAARLQDRQGEAQQHLINVEAARNDPNVRIFRNESIINADIAFEDAIRAAYRATRMYEYYTSTSYAGLEQLFLIRLAAKGTVNLENYLVDLENAFADFEEELGLPDARVAIYSLRDDILQVPFLDGSQQALSQSDRIARMQQMLADPGRLDKNGYITIPFGTAFEQLSPLTRNHKIRYIEANVIGSNVGDRLGRIYLRQRGTSVLQSVDDSLQYFVFPQRTAVVDVYYNGNRVFPPEVYQNLRLKDRPVAHTMWELVINQRDEEVNRDIDLGSLSDIQILIHYTDFTVF